MIRGIIQGFKNIWFYKKIVWYDRNYDYSFLLQMLERKFENIELEWETLTNVNPTENSKTELIIIKSIRKDLNSLITCDFEDELYEKYYKETGIQQGIHQFNYNMTKSEQQKLNNCSAAVLIATQTIQKRLFDNLSKYELFWN